MKMMDSNKTSANPKSFRAKEVQFYDYQFFDTAVRFERSATAAHSVPFCS